MIVELFRHQVRQWRKTRISDEDIAIQVQLLRDAARAIDNWQHLALTAQQSTRDLAIAFRAYCDMPDVDIREDLDALVEELADGVARIEEQIV